MNMKEAAALSQKAKAKGYAMRVKAGKVQFVVVTYDGKGKATESPRSEWLEYGEAARFIAQ